MDLFIYWLILAIFFAIVEMASVAFLGLLLCFSALIMVCFSWLFPDFSLIGQIIIFALLSLASLRFWTLVARHWRKTKGHDSAARLNNRASQYVGQRFILQEDIVNSVGRLQIGDTLWKVRSGEDFIPAGTLVEINASSDNRLSVIRAK